MNRLKLLVLAAIAASTAAVLAQAPAGVTVFEGARVIIGDGRAPMRTPPSSSPETASPPSDVPLTSRVPAGDRVNSPARP